MQPRELLFDAVVDPGQVYQVLSGRFDVVAEQPASGRWTCLDTADWRLHRADMALRDARRGRDAHLHLDAPDETLSAPSPRKAWPARLDRLPESPVRRRIEPAVGVRALLPLVEVDVQSLALRLLDREQKTRVRLHIDQQRLAGASPASLPLRVVVTPLRGYERDAARCTNLLRDAVPATDPGTSAVVVALAKAGFVPGELPASPITLDPGAPAVVSLVAVLTRWLDVAERARPGVLADLDTEYVTDLRTVLAATRSLLALGAHLLPGHQHDFAADFAWLEQCAATVHDLDRTVLELSGHGRLDLAGLDDDGDPLAEARAALARARRPAWRGLRDALLSPRARDLFAEWRQLLRGVDEPDLPGVDTHRFAVARATAVHDRLVAAADGLDSGASAERLHELAGLTHDLTVLLDAYASVVPRPPHRELLRSLAGVRRCLDDVAEARMQRQQLTALAGRLVIRHAPVATLLALGAARDRIGAHEASARLALPLQLRRLTGGPMREHLAALGAAP
ncbi:MAG: CHAD domain-containing protein [Jatrophihabitans sp.]|uniref:CYTH and CHAD domain-containing protein n=1 Tax=Jatrophihabitans sp. TaxID=1932789 RepID=UPI003F7DB902